MREFNIIPADIHPMYLTQLSVVPSYKYFQETAEDVEYFYGFQNHPLVVRITKSVAIIITILLQS